MGGGGGAGKGFDVFVGVTKAGLTRTAGGPLHFEPYDRAEPPAPMLSPAPVPA